MPVVRVERTDGGRVKVTGGCPFCGWRIEYIADTKFEAAQFLGKQVQAHIFDVHYDKIRELPLAMPPGSKVH